MTAVLLPAVKRAFLNRNSHYIPVQTRAPYFYAYSAIHVNRPEMSTLWGGHARFIYSGKATAATVEFVY